MGSDNPAEQAVILLAPLWRDVLYDVAPIGLKPVNGIREPGDIFSLADDLRVS